MILDVSRVKKKNAQDFGMTFPSRGNDFDKIRFRIYNFDPALMMQSLK